MWLSIYILYINVSGKKFWVLIVLSLWKLSKLNRIKRYLLILIKIKFYRKKGRYIIENVNIEYLFN